MKASRGSLLGLEGGIHREIERAAPDYVGLLRRLIATPSPSGGEGPCQVLVKECMEELGVFEKAVIVGGGPPFRLTGRLYEDRPCIVGRLGKKRGPCLILNAHVDAAPVEEPSTWRFPPYSAHVEGSWLCGRGALDDKAGVAMLLLLAGCFRRLGVKLPGSIVFESVIEEEDSGNGTLACTLDGYHCDAAIVIDGTWPFRILDAHLGQVWYHLEISGRPTAACSRGRAVHPWGPTVRAIEAVRDALEAKNRDVPVWEGIASPFYVTVGRLQSGCWPGAVPESCRVDLQVGFPPPYTPDRLRKLVEGAVAKALEGSEGISWHGRVGVLAAPPFTRRGNRMVRTLAGTIERLRGKRDPVQAVAAAGHCDLRHLRSSAGGLADACLYGPGGGENPHVRDEYYRLDDFVPVAQNIASAVLAWFDSAS